MVYDLQTGQTYVLGGRGPFGVGIVENTRAQERGPLQDYFDFLPGVRPRHYDSATVYFAHRDVLVRYGGHGFIGENNLTMEDIRFPGWPGSSQPIRNFPTEYPPVRSRHAMVYDSRRQVAVVFGDYGGPGFTRHADNWELVSYVPGETWINFAHQGIENGTSAFPFNTLAEGVAATPDQGNVRLMSGNTGETGTLSRPMTLHAVGGPVTIGR